MAHGSPAWGVGAPKSTVFQLQDMAELARRLGAPISIDGAGNVIDQDDCEHGLVKGSLRTSGTGAGVAVSSTRARSGAKSYALTAGSDDAFLVGFDRRVALPVLSRVGSEMWFSELSAGSYLSFGLNVRMPTLRYVPEIKYLRATKELQIYQADGTYKTFRTLSALGTAAWEWHGWKLVVDPATGKYVRFTHDQYSDDLSAYSMWSSAAAQTPQVERFITYVGHTGGNDVIYVDDLLLTQNEP